MNGLEKGTPVGRGSPTGLCLGKWRTGWFLTPVVHLARHKTAHLDGHLKSAKHSLDPSSPQLHEEGRADVLILQKRKWHRTVRPMHKGVIANK